MLEQKYFYFRPTEGKNVRPGALTKAVFYGKIGNG